MSQINNDLDNIRMNFFGQIISRLNRYGVSYCIARNYQNHPNYRGDLDLFVCKEDVSRVGKIVMQLCKEYEGVLLLQSYQFSTLVTDTQKIFVFYILDINNGKLYQLDLFMGFSLWGVCVLDSKNIIKNRIWDKYGFFRMAPNQELLIKYFQLRSYNALAIRKKVNQYKSQLGALLLENKIDLNKDYIIELQKFHLQNKYPTQKQALRNRFSLMLNGIKQGYFAPHSRFIYLLSSISRISKHIVYIDIHVNTTELPNICKTLKSNGFFRNYLIIRPMDILFKLYHIFKTVERGGVVFVCTSKRIKNIHVRHKSIETLVIANLKNRCCAL